MGRRSTSWTRRTRTRVEGKAFEGFLKRSTSEGHASGSFGAWAQKAARAVIQTGPGLLVKPIMTCPLAWSRRVAVTTTFLSSRIWSTILVLLVVVSVTMRSSARPTRRQDRGEWWCLSLTRRNDSTWKWKMDEKSDQLE